MIIWNKYKKMPVQAKASIWYTICNFFQKGISFVVVPIYVRLLTTTEYGEWSVFQSWRDVLIIFATLNLFGGVYTKTLVDNKDDRDRFTASLQGLTTIISIMLLNVYFLTHEWCNKVIGLTTPYMLLLFLYFIVYPGFTFWTTRQRVEYKYRSMVFVTIIISILTPALSIILFLITNLRAKALILGYLIIQCGVGFVFYVYHFWKGRCFFHKKYWLYALKFNLPLVPHYLSLIVLNESDRIMIKHYCGESEAGIYSFAYQIASSPISALISAINGSRVPWTYENLKEKTYSGLKRITSTLVVIMAVIVLLVTLLSPAVIDILGTADYQVAIYIIPVLSIGAFYSFIYDLYASIEFYFGATRYVMFASITGAIMNVVLNSIFIPIYGFIAAAYTTLICYIIFMIMHYMFSKKVLREQGITDTVYENGTVFMLCVGTTIACLGCMAAFKYPVICISIIAFIAAGIWTKKGAIKRIIKELKK